MDSMNTKELLKELGKRFLKTIDVRDKITLPRFDIPEISFNWRHPQVTHSGAFMLGAVLTLGVFGLDAMLGDIEYKKKRTGAASVVKVIERTSPVAGWNTTTTATTSDDILNEDEAESLDEEILTEVDEDIEVVQEVVQTSGGSSGSQAAVEEALEEAQELLEELNQQQAASEEEGGSETALFTTPGGIVVDQYGNVVNQNQTGIPAASPESQPDDGTTILPEGVYQLPNGQLVYADGTVYKEQTDPDASYVQQNPVDNYYTSPTGAVFDRQGNLISLPPEEEKELIPPTDIDPDNLPESGTTIYIPKAVKTWSYNNPLYECSVNWFTNDRELCEVYRSHPDDYDWVGVETE